MPIQSTTGPIHSGRCSIGATVAAFSAFNMVALRPLPVRDPQSLVRFTRHAQTRSASDVPYPAVAFYREHTRTLSAVLHASFASASACRATLRASSYFFCCIAASARPSLS